MKVPNNKLSSIKSYFLSELSEFPEAKGYFNFLCDAWLSISKSDLILNPDLEVSESDILKFLYGIKDIKRNRPVQYIAGKTWFYGLEIGVKEGVLIPRPETEELVDWIVSENSKAKSIADIGTGSGCIPLAIKKSLNDAKVSGFDISKDALAIAKENSDSLNLEVEYNEFDALNWREYSKDLKFDLVVSNPPYIPNSDKQLMHSNVLEFEPELALFVDNDSPLVFYKAIADFAKETLNLNGCLYFEIHESFGKETCDMLEEKGFSNIILRKDLQGKDRMVKAVLL